MRRLIVALLLAVGCGEQSELSDPTRLELAVRFGSHLPISSLAIEIDWTTDRAEVTQDVLPHAGPRGLRSVRVSLDLPDPAIGQSTGLRIIGWDGERPLGVATATLMAARGTRTELTLDLEPPGACGDGAIGVDDCDDGNLINGDGCSNTCEVEPGYQCTGAPSRCARCGNGRLEVDEACDDGNLVAGDGCSEACQVEDDVTVWTNSWSWEALEATSTTFVSVADMELPASGEPQLVFVSGIVTGDDTSRVDVQLLLDGEVVDLFGYQLRGDPEGAGAGFTTFELVDPSAEGHKFSINVRATVGAAILRDVTVVAARLPGKAQITALSSDERNERVGREFVVDRLEIPGAQAGRHLLLARMSLSEQPSGGTARGWLAFADGTRKPIDDRGVTFSASRDPLSPLLAMALLDVPPEGTSVQLMGTSSGSGSSSVTGWAEPDAAFRQVMQVSGPADPGYAVKVTFDHAEHVARSRSREDGADVMIVYRPADGGTPVRLHRVLASGSAWNRSNTTVWFRLQASVDATGTDAYDLFMGGDIDKRDDPRQVFSFYDGFNRATLGDGWRLLEGTDVSLENGRLRVDGGTSLASQAGAPPDGSRWEARLRLDPATPDTLFYLTVGEASFSDRQGAAFSVAGLSGHQANTTVGQEAVQPDTPGEFHRYAISRLAADRVSFSQDDTMLTLLAGGQTTATSWSLGVINQGTGAAIYDWVRIRPYQVPEPTVTLGELLGRAGVSASSYRYRKLAAIRLDDWAQAWSAGPAATQRTTEPYAPVVTLNVPAGPAQRLVLQSVRVGGASDPAARRSGQIRANGRTLLTTGHRIDRDDSDFSGYHHIAGLAHVVTGTATLEVGVASPDGIQVSGADGQIIVLAPTE